MKLATTITGLPQNWLEHDRKVQSYVWSHRALGWIQSGLLLVLIVQGIRIRRLQLLEYVLLDNWHGFSLWLLYFGILASVWTVTTLPLNIASYGVDRVTGLSKQTLASWFGDYFKGILLGAGLGTLVLGVFYLCVKAFAGYWWLAAAGFMSVFTVLLAAIAPVLLVPLFFKLEPLKDEALKQRLLALCSRFGVTVSEVYHLGLGAKTEKGNAAFLGLGKTKRIAIGDTIYEKYSPDEVEAVFAHELGHQVHNDIWRSIFIGIGSLFLSFGLAQWICTQWMFPRLFTSTEMPYGFLVFFVVQSVIQIPLSWAQAAHSRWREREADRFAAEQVGKNLPLASALEKLTVQNHSEFVPPFLLELFSYSHPAPWRRILTLRTPR